MNTTHELESGIKTITEFEPPEDLKNISYTFSIKGLNKGEIEIDDDGEENIQWDIEQWLDGLSKEEVIDNLNEFLEIYEYDGIEIDVKFETGLSKPLWECLDHYGPVWFDD